MKRDEQVMDELYKIYCVAESKASRIYEEIGEDFSHPRFTEADWYSRKALTAYLAQRTASLRHILLKLEIACKVKDYLADTMNPNCKDIAPHAIVSAIRDLEKLLT